MTREKMVEKVALTIVGCNQGSWNCWTTEAGGIVDMVLEEAAKVCQELRRKDWSGENEDWLDGTEDCATAIRKLKGDDA
jgi:hypothetical protein